MNDSGVPHFALNAIRIVVGSLFFLNGIAKLVGVFGWEAQEMMTQLWWAGVIETTVGVFVTLGLLTRPFAILGVMMMFAAYWEVHLGRNLFPWANQNGGERPLLFALWFAYFAVRGGGSFSLDGLIAARRRSKV